VKMLKNIIQNMYRPLAAISIVACLTAATILFVSSSAYPSDIASVNVRQVNNEIIVNASLQLDQKMIDELTSGLSKELVFNVDLFRHWKIWPNEFVTGKNILITLQSNPIKREYVGTSKTGNTKSIKRFKDVNSMIAWAVNITDLKLTGTSGLDGDNYFVKVTAESRAHALPAVVGYILFFLPTKEFSIRAK
jgi:hypothetical protein